MNWRQAQTLVIETSCTYRVTTAASSVQCSEQATCWLPVNAEEGVFLCDFHSGVLAGAIIQEDDDQESGVQAP